MIQSRVERDEHETMNMRTRMRVSKYQFDELPVEPANHLRRFLVGVGARGSETREQHAGRLLVER